jgi:hypothetical protein
MNRLNFLIYLFIIGFTFSCNSSKDSLMTTEEEKSSEMAPKTTEDINELIDTYAGVAGFTNVQEEQIREAAKKYNLNSGTQEEVKMQRRLLRKDVMANILTPEQVSALRAERKKERGGGK